MSLRLLLSLVCGLACLTSRTAYAQDPPIVCIDPGHPSEVNPGYTVQNGTTETHTNWVVAKRLEKLLRDKGFHVVMTKSREKQLVRNKERALIANRAGAAVMVRLHCDTGSGQGFALYYPDRTGTIEGVTGPDKEVREQSRLAATDIASEMQKSLAGEVRFDGVLGDSKTYIGGKQGALTGSVFSKVPVVTIEMVVLSNEGDSAFIKSPRGQARMAEAIAAGVVRYVAPL